MQGYFRLSRLVTAAALLFTHCICAFSPLAQDDDGGGMVLRTNTRVVEIDVAVQSAQGSPIEGLRKENFSILDDGKRRSITIFRTERLSPDRRQIVDARPAVSAPPANVFTNSQTAEQGLFGHSTVILLDAVNGWFDNFEYARRGVIGMLNKLPANEQIALYVVSKNQGLVVLHRYTTDRPQLLEAVKDYLPLAMCPAPASIELSPGESVEPDDGLSAPPIPQRTDSASVSSSQRMAKIKATMALSPCRGGDGVQRASEAVRLSLKTLAEQLKGVPGRKSVFWVTQGFPPAAIWGDGRNNTNDAAWRNTISLLNDANVAVNTVDSNGLNGPKRLWGAGTILAEKQLAAETGGRSYYYRNDLDAALVEGITASRSTYVLGFYVDKIDHKYHQLKVGVDLPGAELHYRQGYYSQDAAKPGEFKGSDLTGVLLNPTDATALGIRVTLESSRADSRDMLSVRVTLSPDSLSLKKTAKGGFGEIEELFVELSASGKETGRVSGTKTFDILSSNQNAFERDGVTLVQAFPVSGDARSLSIIVRDKLSGRIGSVTVPLDRMRAQNDK